MKRILLFLMMLCIFHGCGSAYSEMETALYVTSGGETVEAYEYWLSCAVKSGSGTTAEDFLPIAEALPEIAGEIPQLAYQGEIAAEFADNVESGKILIFDEDFQLLGEAEELAAPQEDCYAGFLVSRRKCSSGGMNYEYVNSACMIKLLVE